MKMRSFRICAIGLVAALGAWGTPAHEARACGGCFVAVEDDTQVSQHRMILSVSMEETTLWDQIEYTGAAESFAWVLPIRGEVEVGLSSDLLFAELASRTAVGVRAPPFDCPVSDGCPSPVSPRSTGSFHADESGVAVIVQEVVGPYEAVQISAEEPEALLAWLAQHGYSVPQDIEPVLEEYIESGYGFLALKLVPGESVQAMRPVRVTSKGAGLSLPLRMVAAGTGAVTPITLFVVGEGRYEAANFENFEIDPAALVYDWDLRTSNYASVQQAAFEQRNGEAWLTQWSRPVNGFDFGAQLVWTVEREPVESGYEGDPAQGLSPVEEAEADVEKLVGGLDPESVWITRLTAQLSREALAEDLELSAAASQEEVTGVLQAAQAIGSPPCPASTCPAGDCAVDADFDATGLGAAGAASAAAALALAARRRRRARKQV